MTRDQKDKLDWAVDPWAGRRRSAARKDLTRRLGDNMTRDQKDELDWAVRRLHGEIMTLADALRSVGLRGSGRLEGLHGRLDALLRLVMKDNEETCVK